MQRAGGMGANSRAVINTNFLLNTLHGIGSHNRREEVEDCWRQRRLDQDDRKHGKEEKEGTQGTALPIATGKRRREVSYQKAPLEEAAESVDDTRTFWAEQKQRAMAGIIGAATAMEGAVSTSMQAGTKVERSQKKRNMGEVEGCNSNSGSRNISGAKLLGTERKKRNKKDQKKDSKKDKKDMKSKDSKKEKRKREGRDGRDADNNNVEKSQRKQTSKLESDAVGSSRKKHKKSSKKSTSTRKEHEKHAKRRTEN